MNDDSLTQPPADRFRHTVLLVVIAASLLATVGAWYVMGVRAPLSPTLSAVQAVTTAVLSVLFIATWREWLPQRALELCCLLYIVCICLACMVLRLYSQRFGSGIHIQALYLWMPLVYVFAFMLTSHKNGLVLSLGILGLFVVASLPYLAHDLGGSYANLTVQSHLMSAVMIAMLYFFSSYQHRLRLAQVTVDQLAQLSNTDDLTKLSNRRRMAMLIEAELARFAKGGRGFAVVLFDIDDFKEVNDQCGHGVGDQALVVLAACATEVFQDMGVLGRWGGDEFVALVRDIGAGDAVRMANALCAYVATSPLPGGRLVTISCGVTVARDGDSIDSLLQRADAALYAAKRGGRNRAESILESSRAGGVVIQGRSIAQTAAGGCEHRGGE